MLTLTAPVRFPIGRARVLIAYAIGIDPAQTIIHKPGPGLFQLAFIAGCPVEATVNPQPARYFSVGDNGAQSRLQAQAFVKPGVVTLEQMVVSLAILLAVHCELSMCAR